MTIKVNLLPTERKKITFDPILWVLLIIILAFTGGCVWYGQTLQTKIESKNQEIADTQNKIKEIEQSLPVIDQLKSDIAKLEDEIKMVESLVYDPVRYGNLLGEVGRVLPSNVYLSSLSVEPSTTSVMINGTAKNTGGTGPLATIAGLMSRMSNSEIFTDASLASTSQTGNETDGFGFAFSIEARYNPDAAAGLVENNNNKVAGAKTAGDAVNS